MLRRVFYRSCSGGVDQVKVKEVKEAVEDKKEETMWDDYDTAKEIHRGMATEGFEDVEIKPEHYAMGVRAFAYGTILAVFGVGAMSAAGGWYMGFTHWKDAVAYLRTSPDRALSTAVENGHTVIHHKVDLLDPSSWRETWDAVVNDLEKMEAEQKKD